MKKLVFAVSLLLLISTGFSVVDYTPEENSEQERPDKTQSQPANESEIIENSYIVELEGKPKASKLGKKDSQRSGTQSLETDQKIHSQKLQETRKRFNTELDAVAERPYKVKGKYENVFNGLSVSNISNSTLDEIKGLDEVEKVYQDRKVHVQVQDSVQNIGAAKAHKEKIDGENITGKGVEVAVIDTGTDYTQPDLGGCTFQEVNNSDTSDCRFLPGYDFVDDEYDAMDEREHGTHVAGIVGAKGSDIEGVAPKTKIRPYRVCASAGCSTSNILAAVDRSMDPNNDNDTSDHVDVIQMSIGGPGYPSDPMSQAMNNAFDAGVLPVISAGNSGSAMETVGDPAAARKALAVAAVDDNDDVTQFSSRGPQKVQGSTDILFKPEISAPGYEINSTVPGDSFSTKSGTSMAAPHISGSAALVLQKYSSLEPQEVKSLLTQTSTSINQDNNGNRIGLLESGTGRVNVTEALSTSSVVTPEVLSFGLSNSTGNWWNTSENFTVKNFGNTSKSYSISENVAYSGATLEFNNSSFNLDAGQKKNISADLSVNKEKLGSGEFTGKISVTSDTGEDLEVSYLFVNENFSLDVTPESSREGKFNVKLESPMDFEDYFRDIFIERPDDSTVVNSLYQKGNSDEWRPNNQNFEEEISLDEPGEYRIIANSSKLPGKEASVNVTVEKDSPVLEDSGRFSDSKGLEVNVSSDDNLGRSAGRLIDLNFDHTLFQPEALSYRDNFHIFWDAGGYNTDLRYSILSDGELNQVTELQRHDSGQVKDVSIEKKGSKAFVTWYSSHSSSDECSPYCYTVYGALVDLEEQKVKQEYNITEEVAESHVYSLNSARNGEKVAIGWSDDRVNRSRGVFDHQNASFMLKTYDLGSETLSSSMNVSYNEPVLPSTSLKASEGGFRAFWKASRNLDSTNGPAVYTKKLSSEKVGKERQVTQDYSDIDYSCEGLETEAVCVWRQPTSDADGEIYSASSSDNWSSTFLNESDYGVLKTESTGNKVKLVYKNGRNEIGYSQSYQERTYNGTWSDASLVLEDVEKYDIESLSGVENSRLGVLEKGEVITQSGRFGIGLNTASVYNSDSSNSPSGLFEPEYPISKMKTVEGDSSRLAIFDGKAHQGYYEWGGFGSLSGFIMRVSRRPEATVVLPNGSKTVSEMSKKNGKWTVDLETDKGGTHIYRINATNDGFSTGTKRGFVTRNISDGSNSAPGKPEWRGVEGTTENRTPILNWTEVSDPDGDDLNYILALDSDGNFSSPDILRNLEQTSFRSDKLANGEYSYKVYATDGYQDGEALTGKFNVTDYIDFTVSNNTSIDENVQIKASEPGKFSISKGNWSYSPVLENESGNYSAEFSLHRYGFYNLTAQRITDSGRVLSNRTKKIFVNASRPKIDYLSVEGGSSLEYPTAIDKFEVNVGYATEVTSLNASLEASNSTWSKEFNATIEKNIYEEENYVTGEKYTRAYGTGLKANASGLSRGNYNLTVSLGNKAGVRKENFTVSPAYMNFTATNGTRIGEYVEIEANQSSTVNISRGNWSYTFYLFDYMGSDYSEDVPLYNQGFYNITVFDKTVDGEIFAIKSKKVFVNATTPRIQETTFGSNSDSFPVAGKNITLKSMFDTGVKPLNGSFVVSNSTWSREFNGSVIYNELSEQSYTTDENYTAYSSSTSPGDTVDMKTRLNLTEGVYNITTKAKNTQGLSVKNSTKRLFEELNITASINQEKNKTRTLALFVENQQTPLSQVNLRESKNISVPNITSAGRKFSIAVTSENVSNYGSDKMDYIMDINTSIEDNITVNVTDGSEEKRIEDRVFYSSFSTSYRGKNSTEMSRILVSRNKSKIKERANSLENLTIYNCRNYSQSSKQCLSSWERLEDLQKSSYSTLEFMGLVNYSEAVALGEPVRSCYPDCGQEEDTDDEDESSSGFSGGFTPSPGPQEPEVTFNNSSVTVDNLEAGEASISSENMSINSVGMSNSSNEGYSMSIEKSSDKDEDESTSNYEVYESYEIDLERNGENVEETEDKVNISFSVEKAWIEERGLSREDISLLHRENDSWEGKETSVIEVRDNSVFYSALAGEFSEYMVGADKDEACLQEVISARSPDGNSCRTFTDSCEVPDNWSRVQSCQIAEDRAQAQDLIEDLPDSDKEVREAKDAFQAGNYSEALTLARSANQSINSEDNNVRRDTQNSGGNGLVSAIFGFLAAILGFAVVSYSSYIGYMKYRKRKMLEELNQMTEFIRKGMSSGEIRRDQNILEQIDIAQSKIKSGRYEAANEDMEQLKSYLETIQK